MARPTDKASGERQGEQKPLTEQAKAFARQFLISGNATQAYKLAFNKPDGKATTIAPKASKLLKDKRVQELIEATRGKVADKTADNIAASVAMFQATSGTEAILTLADHLAELDRLKKAAEADKRWGAAITAEVKRGEVSGHYVQRTVSVNHNYAVSDRPVDDPDAWAERYAESAEQPTAH